MIISHIRGSANITIENSPGFIRRDDPAYTSLPGPSGRAPAPIDPAGKLRPHVSLSEKLNEPAAVSKWFYISSAQV